MSGLVPTIVRFPKDELEEYQALAQEMGISFSELVRRLFDDASGSLMFGEAMEARIKKIASKTNRFNLEKYRKWAARPNRVSVEHDKFIYGLAKAGK